MLVINRNVNAGKDSGSDHAELARKLIELTERGSGTQQIVSVEALATAMFTDNVRRVRVSVRGTRWDWSSGSYVRSIVLPALEEKGLVQRIESRLVVIGKPRWELTNEGLKALEELRTLMEIGRGPFRELVRTDREWAIQFIGLAGPALLLMPEIAQDLRVLNDDPGTGFQESLMNARIGSGNDERIGAGVGSNGFGAPEHVAMGGVFGPGLYDGLDGAYFAISETVDRAWDLLHRSVGGLIIAGE